LGKDQTCDRFGFDALLCLLRVDLCDVFVAFKASSSHDGLGGARPRQTALRARCQCPVSLKYAAMNWNYISDK